MYFHHFLFFLILTFFPSCLAQNSSVSCPLNFTIIRPFFSNPNRPQLSTTITMKCHYIRQGLRLVLSDYLRRTESFFPP